MANLEKSAEARKPSPKPHRFGVTFFKNAFARSLESKNMTLEELRDLVMTTSRSTKDKLPWLKLARFGDLRTSKNSLRHDDNLLTISGIELDYDQEQVSFSDAVADLQRLGVSALVYTSPSHTETKPRWRVLLPTSKELPLSERERLCAAANDALGGVCAPESFTKSQSYFYGVARDNPAPDHRGVVLEGEFIDALAAQAPDRGDRPAPNPQGKSSHLKTAAKAAPNVYHLFAEEVGAGQPHGFEGHLGTMGDGPGLKGFNFPIIKAVAAFADAHGAAFSRADLKQRIRKAIDAAPKKPNRPADVIKRYRGDDFLDKAMDSAVRKFAPPDDETNETAKKTIRIVATPFQWKDPSQIPKREWLYGRHLIRKFGAGLIASGGTGKSSLLLVEALAMVTGRRLLGIKPVKPLRVWYWGGEDPQEETERRVAAICKHFHVTAEQIGGRLFLDSGRDCKIIIATQGRDGVKVAQPVVDQVKQAIIDNSIDVVMIDPFVSCHRVSENDNNSIEAVAKTWTEIADETNCAVELAHHIRKTGGTEATAEDSRGAGALVNALRALRVLNPMSEAEHNKSGVENRRRYFKLSDGKMNLAPPAEKAEWRHLVSVDLGNGDPKNPAAMGDAVAVVTNWDWPEGSLIGLTQAHLDAIRKKIMGGTWRAHPQANDWAGKAIALCLGMSLAKRDHRASIEMYFNEFIELGWLREVSRRDEARRETKTFIEIADGEGHWILPNLKAD